MCGKIKTGRGCIRQPRLDSARHVLPSIVLRRRVRRCKAADALPNAGKRRFIGILCGGLIAGLFSVGAWTQPEIDVQRPVGTSIADGGTDAQGYRIPDEQVALTYTVRNTGTATLNVTDIASANPNNVTVYLLDWTSSPIDPGATQTFEVQYVPLPCDGPFSFDLCIRNDDPDENPYEITVYGGVDLVPPALSSPGPPASSPYKTGDSFAISVDIFDLGSGVDDATVVADLSQLGRGAAEPYDSKVDHTYQWEITVGALADGLKTYAIDALDNVGNAAEQAEGAVRIDNTDPNDPTLLSRSHAVDVWSNDGTVDIEVSGASDPGGSGVDGFEIEWDQSSAWQPTETKEQEKTWSGATFTATANGNWYFHIATVDNAGNWTSTQRLGPFRIDMSPPLAPTELSPTDGAYTSDSSPTFSWDPPADPGGSGLRETDTYRYVVSGTPSRAGYTANTTYTPTLAEGEFTWKIYARDNAGNHSDYTSDVTLYIDTTVPNDPALGSTSHTVGVVSNDDTVDITIGSASDPTSNGVSSGVDGYDTAWDQNPTWAATEVKDRGETWGGGTFTAPANGDWYFHIATVDNAGNWTTSEHLGPFPIDTHPPTVARVTVSDAQITDSDVGTAAFEVTVEFDEPMDAEVGPTLIFDPGVGSTLVLNTGLSGWTGDDTYVAKYDVTDANVDEDSVTIDATGAQDLAGNVQEDYTPEHEFAIDTRNPSATVTTDHTVVEADSPIYEGSLVLTVTVAYDEAMDTGTTPSISLVDGGTVWSGPIDLGWSGETIYRATFAHDGTEEEVDGVIARKASRSGATDVAGNTDVGGDSPRFGVDTRKPTVTIDLSQTLVTDADVGRTLTVTLDYDEAMNASIVPTLALDPGLDTTLSQRGAGWTDSDTYAFTYTILDGGVTVKGDDVQISGARDLAGNVQAPKNRDDLDVDTENPILSGQVVTGGAVDVSCLRVVTFSATATDPNGCMNPDDVAIASATVVTGNASIGSPYDIVRGGAGNTVTLSGKVDVRDLSGCPATARIVFDATDCVGNPAEQVWAEGDVVDEIEPIPRDDPRQDVVLDESAIIDPLVEVRLDGFGVYRLLVREDTPVRLDVLANDADNCDCGMLYVQEIVAQPTHGTATIEDGEGDCNGESVIRYAPDRGYTGPDEFTYRIRDACGNMSSVIATVYVQTIAEVAMEDVYVTACSGEPESFTVSASDLWVDYDPTVIPFLFSIVDGPEHGIVTGDPTRVTLTPPSTVDVGGEPVLTLDFTEAAEIALVYTSAVGYTGWDAVTIRFADPFGNHTTGRVDVSVIECAGDVGLADVVVRQGEILPIIAPEGFESVVETAWGGVLLIDLADGTEYSSALSAAFSEEIDRYVVYADTESLPIGRHLLVIPLGNGETVELTIEAEAG